MFNRIRVYIAQKAKDINNKRRLDRQARCRHPYEHRRLVLDHSLEPNCQEVACMDCGLIKVIKGK